MARINRRTVLNRKALEAITSGYVDGMEAMAQTIVDITPWPDAPTIGQGLIESPDWGIWVDGKKVAGTATKPRRVRVKSGVTLVAGAGFPMRFYELGTVHQPARPTLTPVVMAIAPGAEKFIKPKVRERLRGVR